MSGTAVVAYLLSQNAPLVAVVPAARIFAADELPMGTTLPAINVSNVSSSKRLTVSMADASKMHTERVQVTVHAKSGVSRATVVALVRAALPVSRGAVNGVKVDSILPDQEADLSQPEADIHEHALDFFVKWTAAN